MTDQPPVPPRYQSAEIRIIVNMDAMFQLVVLAKNGNVLFTDRGYKQFGFARRKALNVRFSFWNNIPASFQDSLGVLYNIGERAGILPYYTKQAIKKDLERVGKKRRLR